MQHFHVLLPLAAAALAATTAAQGPDFLLTFSQPETTLSGSAGTVLRFLAPNEIAHLDATMPCPRSAEKWSPRTCFHTMAGDENGDGTYWNPALFGTIDALCQAMPTSPVAGGPNPRTVFWSVSAPMGTSISGPPGLRPGDVGRIVRTTAGDGKVEYFMRQELFDKSLGLPPTTPIDVDAIAWSPNYGIFFSLDQDIAATTPCGPTFVRDGDVLLVPPAAITWTPDFRVANVALASAYVLHNEAQMDAFVAAAAVSDRFGACVANAVDTEALEIDWAGPATTFVPCIGPALPIPSLLFATETMTGASLLTTAFGGQIYTSTCGAFGRGCGGGATLGIDTGIQPTSGLVGAPSHINGIVSTFAFDHVLEPQQHVMNVFPLGAPFGSTLVDYHSPYAFNFVFVEVVPPTVPGSLPAFPFSLLCFPDAYIPNLIPHVPAPGPWGSFPMVAIPPLWTGKVLFQSIGFGGSGFELSTPTVIDVQ